MLYQLLTMVGRAGNAVASSRSTDAFSLAVVSMRASIFCFDPYVIGFICSLMRLLVCCADINILFRLLLSVL